jgi:hypothetical protein
MVSLHGVAGIRWYYAVLAGMAAALLTIGSLGTIPGRGRDAVFRAIAAIALTAGLHTAIVWGGGVYMPHSLLVILEPWKREPPPATKEEIVGNILGGGRKSFEDRRNAGTHIRPGPTLMVLDGIRLTNAPYGATFGTILRRIAVGTSAMFLPVPVATQLRLISVGGGRGLLPVTSIETILVLILAIVVAIKLVRHRRIVWRDPLVLYLVIVSIGLTASLAYTVTNYGALVRYRGMIVASLVLLLLAIERRPSRSGDADPQRVHS